MTRVNIIGWIAKRLKALVGIVEDTDTATHAIAKGKYVIWKGSLRKTAAAIGVGDALSSSNLSEVSEGIGNELNSNITNHATANHYDTITGGEVLSHGDIRIINMLDSNATIPTTGVKLIDKANYQNIRSMCKYFNGSADTTGFLKIETSGNDTYLYVTNLSGSKVSATYVSGSLVYTASSYNG